MIKQALIGLTAAALLAGCGGEDKAQAPAAKAADGRKTVGLVQLVEHPALDATSPISPTLPSVSCLRNIL